LFSYQPPRSNQDARELAEGAALQLPEPPAGCGEEQKVSKNKILMKIRNKMYEAFLSLCFKEIMCFQERIIGICEPKYLQIRRKISKSL